MPDGITAIAADGTQHMFPQGTDPAIVDRTMKQYASTVSPPRQQGPLMPNTPMSPFDMKYAAYGATPSNILGSLGSVIKGTYQTGKELLMPQGDNEWQRWKDITQKLVLDPAQQEMTTGNKLVQAGHPIAGKVQQEIAQNLPVAGPMIGGWLEDIRRNNIAGPVTQAATIYAGGKLAKKAGWAASNPRQILQESLNIGPSLTEDAIKKYHSDYADAVSDHEAKVQQVKFDHQQQVSEEMAKHASDTQSGLTEQAKKIQQINEDYNKKLSDIDQKHADRADKINKQNEAAQHEAAQRTQLEAEAKQLQQHLGDHISNLESEVRTDAKSRYPQINGTIPSSDLYAAAKSALEKLQGSSNPPTLLKRIMDENSPQSGKGGWGSSSGPSVGGRHFDLSNPSDLTAYQRMKASGAFTPEEISRMEGTASKDIPFDKLHGYFSEIGQELGKENLPNDVRAANSDMYAKSGEFMRKLAEADNKGPQFMDAQANWKQYIRTFHDGKPLSMGGSPVAKFFHAVDPEYVAETGPYASRYLTGDLAEKAVKQLGKYTDLGAQPDLVNALRDKLEQIDQLPSTLKLKDLPEHPGYPSRPRLPEAKVPPPYKGPQSVKYPTADLPDVPDPRSLKVKAISNISNQLKGEGGLRLSLDLLSIIRAIKSGDPSLLAYPIGRRLAGRALSKPGTMDWLSKPTSEELKSLPKIQAKKVATKKP